MSDNKIVGFSDFITKILDALAINDPIKKQILEEMETKFNNRFYK